MRLFKYIIIALTFVISNLCALSAQTAKPSNIELSPIDKAVRFYIDDEILVKIPRKISVSIDGESFKLNKKQTLRIKDDNAVLWLNTTKRLFKLSNLSDDLSDTCIPIALVSKVLGHIKYLPNSPYYINDSLVENVDKISPSNEKYIYVSSSHGSDDNQGTEMSPLKSIRKASSIVKKYKGIKLKCGDVFYERIEMMAGKELSSYGEGHRPVMSGLIIPVLEKWEEGVLDDRGNWIKNDHSNIWRLHLAGPASHYDGFIVNGSSEYNNIACIYDIENDSRCNSKKHSYYTSLKENFDFCQGWWIGDYIKTKDTSKLDYIYIYYDGDPNDLKLGLVSKATLIRTLSRDGCIIDGIELRCANFGISAGASSNIVIRNCFLDVIGGSTWDGQVSKSGEYTRWGNGIEFYVPNGDKIENVLVENNVVSRSFDAGMTLQGYNYCAENVLFVRNFLDGNSQNWENFNLPVQSAADNRKYVNCTFSQNICLNGGQELDIRYNYNKRNQLLIGTNSESENAGGILYQNNLFINGTFRGSAYHQGRGFFGEYYDNNLVFIGFGQNLCEPEYAPTSSKAVPMRKDNAKDPTELYRSLTGDKSTIFRLADVKTNDVLNVVRHFK